MCYDKNALDYCPAGTAVCEVPALASLAVEGDAALVNVHLSGVTANSDDLQAAVAAAVASSANVDVAAVEIVGMADVAGANGEVVVGVLVSGASAGDAEAAAVAVTNHAASGELAADIGGDVTVNGVYGQMNGASVDPSTAAAGDGALGSGDAIAGQDANGGTGTGSVGAATGSLNMVTVAFVALALLLLLALIALAVVVVRRRRSNRVYGLSGNPSHAVHAEHATAGSPAKLSVLHAPATGRTPPRMAFV